MIVQQIFDDFVRHHREHSARSTVEFYQQGLAWFARAFGPADWESLDRLAVRDALVASYHRPDGTPFSPATHRRNKVSFAQLQRHAIDQEFTAKQILTAKDLTKPGTGRRETIPSAEELDRLIAAAEPAAQLAFRGLRASGMRPGELCQADAEMIERSSDGRRLVLKRHKTAKKTGKPRVIAIGGDLADVVDEALGERTAGPVWLDGRGGRWTPERLSTIFRATRDRLGIDRAVCLYTIRHYVGTLATRAAGIHAAATLLGHTSISMTQRYAHGDESDQRAAMAGVAKIEADRRAA